jgi:hypothetical protein
MPHYFLPLPSPEITCRFITRMWQVFACWHDACRTQVQPVVSTVRSSSISSVPTIHIHMEYTCGNQRARSNLALWFEWRMDVGLRVPILCSRGAAYRNKSYRLPSVIWICNAVQYAVCYARFGHSENITLVWSYAYMNVIYEGL